MAHRPTTPRAVSTFAALAAGLLLTVPAGAGAQSAARLPRALELPLSTRAMALGDAYMMNAGHADAIFYHPALLVDAGGFGLDHERWGDQGRASAMSGAMKWWGGAVGVGLVTAQYAAPSTNVHALPAGQDHRLDRGAATVSEQIAVVGYADEIFDLKVGVAGKLVEERFGEFRDASAGIDFGVAAEFGRVTLGLTAQNLGADLSLAEDDAALPSRITLGGGGYGMPVGPLDLGLTGALSRHADGEYVPALGVEVGWWPVVGRTIVARAGVRRVPHGDASPFTFGLAFWGDDLVLEWAYQPFTGRDEGAHRFGVRWR